MASTLEEFTALLSLDQGGDEHDNARYDSWRTAQLKQVLSKAEQAWLDVSHKSLALAAEAVADAAREPYWRPAVGESGLLDFFVNIVLSAEGLGQQLKKQSLRLVGNACAECDENKARVVQTGKLGSVIFGYLDSEDLLLSYVISVIYNICIENDEGIRQAHEAGLSKRLVSIIAGPRLVFCDVSMSTIMQLLEQQLLSQDVEPKEVDLTTPALLLGVASSRAEQLDAEEFAGIYTVALAYLTYEKYQIAIVESDGFPALQQAFYRSQTTFNQTYDDPDLNDQLKQIRNASVTIYADISALPSFASKYPIESPVVQQFISWLGTPPSCSYLQTTACLCLGNLSRSDATSTTLASNDAVLSPLFAILSRGVPPPGFPAPPVTERPSAQLLHAVLGFLKNLAIPNVNKLPLADGLLHPPNRILPRLWTTTAIQPQVLFAAVSLTRLLLVANPISVKQLCTPLPPDNSETYRARDGPACTNLHILLDAAERTDATHVKMEAGRALCNVIRALHSTEGILDSTWTWAPATSSSSLEQDTPDRDTALARFYAAHEISIVSTMGQILTQTYPTLQSEALFVLALMARSTEGGRVVIKVLEPAEVVKVLAKAVVGRDLSSEELGEEIEASASVEEGVDVDQEAKTVTPTVDTGLIDGLGLEPQGEAKALAGMERIDRENGLVLVAEVVKGFSEHLAPHRRRLLERLLSEGGELVLAARHKGQHTG